MEEPVAIIAVLALVIKELISFLKERKDSKWTGAERRAVDVSELNNSIQLLVLPILAKQTEILISMATVEKELDDKVIDMNYNMKFGITGLKENQEKMRVNLHEINGKQQTIIGLLSNLKGN